MKETRASEQDHSILMQIAILRKNIGNVGENLGFHHKIPHPNLEKAGVHHGLLKSLQKVVDCQSYTEGL